MRSTSDKITAFMTMLRKKMNFKSLVITLAAIVVFTTTYLLIFPAFTLDKEEAAEQGGIDVAVEQTVDEEAPAEKAEEPAAEKKESAEAVKETEEPAAKDEVKEETASPKQKDNEAKKEDSSVKEEKEEVKLLSKKKELTAEKEKKDDFTISAIVDKDAKVPEDVFLQAAELTKDTEDFDYDKYYKDALKALKKDSSSVKEIKTIRFYDISLEADSQDESVEPKAAVSVKIAYDDGLKVKDADNIRIVHFAEQKNGEVKAEVLDSRENKVETTVNKKSEMTEASFDTEGFSVFAVAETDELAGGIVTADGSAYEVTVKYGADAGVPDGATLEVSELTKDSEEYQKYMEQTAEAVGTAVEDLDYLKLLDISIMDGDEKVEIQAPVDVQIKLLDKKDKNAGEKTSVVHFGKDETAVIEPDVEGKTVNFETTGFSYYAVTSYGATADLNEKSYAIVQVNTQATQDATIGNNTVHEGRALATNVPENGRLGGTTVSVELHESGYNLVTNGNTQVVKWKFVSAGGANTYNIQAPNGQYLTLNNGVLALSNTPQALTVTAGTGNNAGKVQISNGGNRRVTSSASANSRTADNNQNFYNSNSNDVNYVYLTLCEIEEFNLDADVYQAEKVSVQDLYDGGYYIIYKNIYNNATGKYEDWVIDGMGNPVRAYDQGDSVSLHSKVSPMWRINFLKDSSGQLTGYYIFQNEETGLILHPTADGTLVKEYEATSPTTDGVTLEGRRNGEYTSSIKYWDDSAKAYYGYQFNSDDTVTISSVREENVQALSFAGAMPPGTDVHPVDTVDSAAAGITIHMFNYENRRQISSVTGSDSYAVQVLPQQHVTGTLSESGYPHFTNGNTGEALFNPRGSYHQGTGNHLFLESVYDSTGYYEYSAFNNFAHYDKSTGNFKVYEETGTPSYSSDNFYFKRGNFFPFNSLNTNNRAQNIYTGDGSLIDYENPNYGSDLYGFSEDADYYFGMTMNFNFLMPKDGYEKGSPLIYEFNGDDDLWIYIDDVLILDIGGVHDAFPGTINFATGEITGGNGGADGARTIKACFKNAGVFPDGTPWDDSKVDEYFNGDTFASYGSHEFNMFYMEHGAGASNLKMRFNLPVIEKGKVIVEKKLSDDVQVAYADVEYAYQIFAKNENGYYLVDPANPQAVYEGTTESVKTAPSAVINGKTYEKVFYLRPNEAAVFSDLIEDENYYVREIGIDSDIYRNVYVNDVEVFDEGDGNEDGVYTSSESTPRRRARLTYKNVPVTEELRITKELAEGSADNGDTFEFRVLLENTSNKLVAYSQGTYYIHDDKGVYYRYEGGRLVRNGSTPYPWTSGVYGTIANVPPKYTVEIPGLMPGTDFYVDEIRVRPNGGNLDILIGNSDWEQVNVAVTDSDEGEIEDAEIYDYATTDTKTVDSLGRIALDKNGNKNALVTFTNKRRAVPVQLKKIDAKDEATTLDNVTFDLYADAEHTQKLKSVTTADGGYADLGELVTGTYYLKEILTLDGYDLLANDVQIIVDGSGGVTYIQKEYRAGVTQIADKEKDDKYTVIVRNYTGEELPMTGGIGTTIFYILGSILAVGCGIVLIARRRAGISR